MGEVKCFNCGNTFTTRNRNDREPKFCSRECLYKYRRNNGFSEEVTKVLSMKTSNSLKGVKGELSRRWKGDNAGYVAKHIWIKTNYGKASKCELNSSHIFRRFEWANISGKYERNISDYIQLCPSCHRKFDLGKLKINFEKRCCI